MSAMTGAAPVPVPPPSPAVTNTMSAPLSASLMSSRDSAAAPNPTSGLAPAPRPFVSSWPMFSLMSASHICSACASVLAAMNSTRRGALRDANVEVQRACGLRILEHARHRGPLGLEALRRAEVEQRPVAQPGAQAMLARPRVLHPRPQRRGRCGEHLDRVLRPL